MKSFLIMIKYIEDNTIKYCLVKIDTEEEYNHNIIKEAERILKCCIAAIKNAKDYLNNPIRIIRSILVTKEFYDHSLDIAEATKIFIYKDENIQEYVMRKSAEADLSILNYINDEYKVKIFVIEDERFKEKEKIKIIEDMTKKYLHTNQLESSIYNLKNNDNKIDYLFLKDLMKKDKNIGYVIYMKNMICIEELEEIVELLKEFINLYVMIQSNRTLYRIKIRSNQILFEKVRL